jgi:hypothetical protein
MIFQIKNIILISNSNINFKVKIKLVKLNIFELNIIKLADIDYVQVLTFKKISFKNVFSLKLNCNEESMKLFS